MSPARVLALTVRFLLELALLAGVGVLAWHVTDSGWRWVAAIGAVAVVATAWGLLLSPKAPVRLRPWVALTIEAALFLGVAAGLAQIGYVWPAVIAIVWAIDRTTLALVRV